MARIFTTKFRFNHQDYDAIVTVISHNDQLNFNVRILDTELYDLIPGGNLQYVGKDGFKEIEFDNQLSRSLMRTISFAIEEHLVPKI